MKAISLLALATAVAAAGAHVTTNQQPASPQAPTFRTRTDVVQLDVSVLDKQGVPVRGLTEADFTVLEGDVPQPIVAFAAVDVPTWSPGQAEWMREIGPDVATNRRDAQRVVVIVLDDVGTPWDPGMARTARDIATATIDRLGPADLAAVVYVLSRRQGQEFTVDRARLRASVDRFMPSGVAPPADHQFSASRPGRGLVVPSRASGGSGASGACPSSPGNNCLLEAIRNAADILRSWPGVRKSVVLISPGKTPNENDPERIAERADLRDLFAALQEGNVNVYQFDPRGLEVGRSVMDDFGMFAENTGGRAVTNTNGPGDLVPQMFRENSSYYLLGFRRTDDRRDGRFRRIAVKVNRPGVEVRTRSGYVSPSDAVSKASTRNDSASDRALSGGLPTGDLPMSLTVAPFAMAEKPRSALALVARVHRDPNLADSAAVELRAAAFSDNWKQVAEVREQFMLPAQSADKPHVAEMGARLNLPPGRYEVRVAMTNATSGLAGSVYTSVTIPNFAKDPLSMSGIVIERGSRGAAMPQHLAALLPVRPTTERAFAAADTVTVFGRLYQGGNKALAPVRVVLRIVDEQNRAVLTEETIVEAAAFGGKREADYRFKLPLSRLAAGEHLLTLEAGQTSSATRREIRITVLP
jgi:VWFA-related protein